MRFALVVWINATEENLLRSNPSALTKVRNQLAVGCEMLQLPADRGEIRRQESGEIVEVL